MALSPRAKQPVLGYEEEYCAAPPTGRRIGISLSGGGIRSAAFNLGALQALQEEGVLGSADYLAAVSGGGYIAGALTISHAYAESDAEDGHPLWAHGSPEERLLRRNTNYLAPGQAGRAWLVMNLLHGFVLNYLPFLLSGFIAGRVVGWLAHLGGGVAVGPAVVDRAGAAVRRRDLHPRGRRGGRARPLPRRAQGRPRLRRELAGEVRGAVHPAGRARAAGAGAALARRPVRDGDAGGARRSARDPVARAGRPAGPDRGGRGLVAPRARAGGCRRPAGAASAGALAGVRVRGAREWRSAARAAAVVVGVLGAQRHHVGVGRAVGAGGAGRRAADGDQGAQPPLLDAPVLPRAAEQRVRRQASFRQERTPGSGAHALHEAAAVLRGRQAVGRPGRADPEADRLLRGERHVGRGAGGPVRRVVHVHARPERRPPVHLPGHHAVRGVPRAQGHRAHPAVDHGGVRRGARPADGSVHVPAAAAAHGVDERAARGVGAQPAPQELGRARQSAASDGPAGCGRRSSRVGGSRGRCTCCARRSAASR